MEKEGVAKLKSNGSPPQLLMQVFCFLSEIVVETPSRLLLCIFSRLETWWPKSTADGGGDSKNDAMSRRGKRGTAMAMAATGVRGAAWARLRRRRWRQL